MTYRYGTTTKQEWYLEKDGDMIAVFDTLAEFKQYIKDKDLLKEIMGNGPWHPGIEDVDHGGPSDIQEFMEGFIKRQEEHKGYKNVSVGVPFPYGPEVLANIKQERVTATISHDGGEHTAEYLLEPLLEAFALAKWREYGKPDVS